MSSALLSARQRRNPERKLRLWAEQHKAQATNEVERRKGDIGEKGSRTAEQKEARRRHKRRRKTAKETGKEVDRETDLLLEKAEDGTLTLAEIDALRERKGLELELEMRHEINITNETTARADGSQVVWTADELENVEATLDRIPAGSVGGKGQMAELRRAESRGAGVGGVHSGDRVTITDVGARPGVGFRHGGDPRELASPEELAEYGPNVSPLEFVLAHEIGHDVEEQHVEAFAAFQKAAGWEDMGATGLAEAGLTPAQVAQLEATRGQHYGSRNTIAKDGRTFMVDPYSGRYLAVEDTGIPQAGEAEPGAAAPDTWDYARSNPRDHFAETYAKAVNVPEKLYKDLVERPAEAARLAHSRVERKRQELALRSRSPAGEPMASREELDALSREIVALEREAAAADRARTQREAQHQIMRNDVFGTDNEVAAARARLQTRGANAEELATFEAQAARAATPRQVQALEGQVRP